MSVQNATVLKSFFETNDQPSQQQFGDLIDTLQEARDNATAAAALAGSAQTIAGTALSSATSRVLRAGDTMTGALSINGSADVTQLLVKESAIQSFGLLADFQNFAGQTIFGIGPNSGVFIEGKTDTIQLWIQEATTQSIWPAAFWVDKNSFQFFQCGSTIGTQLDGLVSGQTVLKVRAFAAQAAAVFEVHTSPSAFVYNTAFAVKNNNEVALSGAFVTHTQGIITTDLPGVNHSVTWNQGGTAFTAWKSDVTDAASSAASLLMDLQVGTVSKFNVSKAGLVTTAGLYISPAPDTVPFTVNGYSVTAAGSSGVLMMSGQWNTSGTPTAIKLNITDSASNAASLLLDLQIGSGSQFKVTKAGVVTSTGRLNAVGASLTDSLLFTDNSYDIGASGATRPRTLFAGTSVVSPAFMIGASVLNVTYSAYSAGTVYTVTATNALADFGTTDPSITIAAAGTYILSGFVKVDLNAATFASNRLFTARIRRTNNTAANIANSDSTFSTGTPTIVTQTMAIIPIKDVIYTTANANDVLEIWVDISVLPDAGTLTIEQASIVATRIS